MKRNREERQQITINDYAETEEEATAKHSKYLNEDPYPTVIPALLNSADIAAYVKATALIYPFHPNNLQGASYDVGIRGMVVYWKYLDSGEIKEEKTILEKEGDCFDLEPNSIAFVTLEPTFRIPTYLALRFNLKITHVYKGLLLGTGPLVDPGFIGKLSIPLHNLTSNTYRLFYDDLLITMEFTKMSQNKEWMPESEFESPHNEIYVKNKIASHRTVEEYIAKALKKDRLNCVISSIPDAVNESKKEVRSANKIVKKMRREAVIQTTVSIIAVCTLVFSAITLSLNAVNKAHERYDTLYEEYIKVKEKYDYEIIQLREELRKLESAILDSQNQEDLNPIP